MIEVVGNLWEYPADFRVITTNGFVKSNGSLVMGRGCAREARDKFPHLDKHLGSLVKDFGNVVHVSYVHGLITFPVKHNWWEQADIELIEKSAHEIVGVVNVIGSPARVVLPRPGCGNGGLSWEQVKPVIEPILDDRFHVITFPKRG